MLATLCLMLTLGQAPALEGTPVVVTYDMSYLFELDLADPEQRREFWDTTHLVVSLQGIVNRDAPRLYIRYVMPTDDFWWDVMTEPGGWLEGARVEQATDLTDLLERFAPHYKGAVAWDDESRRQHEASTIAGRRPALPALTTHRLTYQRLTAGGGAPSWFCCYLKAEIRFHGHGTGTALSSGAGDAICGS